LPAPIRTFAPNSAEMDAPGPMDRRQLFLRVRTVERQAEGIVVMLRRKSQSERMRKEGLENRHRLGTATANCGCSRESGHEVAKFRVLHRFAEFASRNRKLFSDRVGVLLDRDHPRPFLLQDSFRGRDARFGVEATLYR